MSTPIADRPRDELAEELGVATDSTPPHVSADRSFFRQPRGLSTLFFTEMWERFSYYGIRPLLVLFMTAAITSGGFGFARENASAIVGIYAASVYLASLPGGWIADRLLGLQRSVWYGGVLIALGHLSIGLSAIVGRPAFFVGLTLIVLGTGLLKPNVSAMVGDLYPEGGARRDAGFSIFYMGINLGALIAPLVTGYLGERVGWHWGFGAAGVGMAAGLVQYHLTRGRTLRGVGERPNTHADPAVDARQKRQARAWVIGGVALVAVVLLLTISGLVPVSAVAVAAQMRNAMLALAVVYFAYMLLFGGLNGDEKKRVGVIAVLFVFSMIFWSAFEQAPTSLNLFAADYTDRRIFGWEMPALWLQSFNSLFVILLAPAFAALWVRLARGGIDLSSPTKFALGLAFTAAGFGLMIAAARLVVAGGGARVSPWWLIGSYLFQTFGELSISPVGMSTMTKLAPRRFAGQMMGVWFMSLALGNVIAGLIGGHVNPEQLSEMPGLFRTTAMSLVIASAVLTLLIVPVRRMMARAER